MLNFKVEFSYQCMLISQVNSTLDLIFNISNKYAEKIYQYNRQVSVLGLGKLGQTNLKSVSILYYSLVAITTNVASKEIETPKVH